MNGALAFWALVLVAVASTRLGAVWWGNCARRAVRSAKLSAQNGRVAGALYLFGLVAVFAAFPESPLLGLASLVLIPIAFQGIQVLLVARCRKLLAESGLVYLHGLRGLVHSGFGLSAALFQMAKAQPTPFSVAMARSLEAFETGKSLEACLEKFQVRYPHRLLGTCMRSLQMAYRQGLPALPILDQMIPLLEMEQERVSRVADQRAAAFAQAGVAFCVPWFLLGAMRFFLPADGGVTTGAKLIMAVLATEMVGAGLLVRSSSFYLRRNRVLRKDLLVFLDAVSVMMQAGFDLAYAWGQVREDLGPDLAPDLRRTLDASLSPGFHDFLAGLSKAYPDVRHRFWFGVLGELYGTGTTLGPSLAAVTTTLRREQEREWKNHLHGLPFKTSLLLAFFFLVPALVLIFMPLLEGFETAF